MTSANRMAETRKYLAAACAIGIAIGPAAAVDLGVGVRAGGIGIGTSVGVGQKGVSLGIGAGLGGLGRADVGASVGTDKGSVGASVGVSGRLGGKGIGVSGNLGGTSGGVSIGAGGGGSSVSGATGAAPGAASGRSTAASLSGGNSNRAKTASVASAKGIRQAIALPRILMPSSKSGRNSDATAFEARPGTPIVMVRACREAIETAAIPFGVVSVRARSAGTLRRLSRSAVLAPIQVRIRYARQGGAEIRQARISCHLDATGRVIKLT
jgi:hypothetical protein